MPSLPITSPATIATVSPSARYSAGHLPAEHAEQQRQRHFVDHGRGNQEGKGHPQRHAGLQEADEQRHRRTGTERRDDAQAGRHHVARAEASPRQQRAGALRRDEGMDDAHDEDDAGEQQQHLGRIVEEELQRAAQMAVALHRQRGDQRFGSGDQGLIEQQTTTRRPGAGRAAAAGRASVSVVRRRACTSRAPFALPRRNAPLNHEDERNRKKDADAYLLRGTKQQTLPASS